jgi:HlyD family secretion protein
MDIHATNRKNKYKQMRNIFISLAVLLLASCKNGKDSFDAQGSFEAVEILVSPEISGRITSLDVDDGDSVAALQEVGRIDATNLSLQKEQVDESIQALRDKTTDPAPQVALLYDQLAVEQTQLKNLQRELERAEGLLRNDAGTSKQVDDIRYQKEAFEKKMAMTRQQIVVQRSNNANQNRAILSEGDPLRKRAAQLEDLVKRSAIVNPVSGTVITTYAEAGEMAVVGKPLYKVADMRELILRAYVTGGQLPLIRTGQQVKVFTDKGPDAYNEHLGTISWISSKAEFTPKTIQTKDERANLVYAIKVIVKNDGLLKIGMYGEIKF